MADEAAALRARVGELERELAECRQLVSQVMEAEEYARRRIAQLIHDDSLQSLLAANQELIEAAPGRAQVMRAHEVVEGTIARLRDAMLALHPVTIEQGGFEIALGAVARAAGRQGGFEVELDLDQAALGAADELLLSVARELLTNAARHSGAGAVSVALRRAGESAESVELVVRDDGCGLDPKRREEALGRGHLGLATVTQRLHAAGGGLEIDSSPSGTSARAWVPLERPAAAPPG